MSARKTTRAYKNSRSLNLVIGATPTTAPTSASDGKAVSDLNLKTTPPLKWRVEIHSPDRSTPSTITAGGFLYGWNGEAWYSLINLNGGSDIAVGAQGYSETVEGPGLYTRLAFAAATISASIDVMITPIYEIDVS